MGVCVYAVFFEKLDPEGFYGVVKDLDGNEVQKLFPTEQMARQYGADDIQDLSTIFNVWYIGTFIAIWPILILSTGHFWFTTMSHDREHIDWDSKLDWPLMVAGFFFVAIWFSGILIRFRETAEYVCADYRRVGPGGTSTDDDIPTDTPSIEDGLVQEYSCDFLRITLTGMGFYIGGLGAWYALMSVGATNTPIYWRRSSAGKHCCYRCLNCIFRCGSENGRND